MRPLTEAVPKPLVPLAGKPLIDHVLDRLAAAGITRAVVNVHHLADKIEKHVASRESPKSSYPTNAMRCSIRVAACCGRCPNSGAAPFLIHNSDSVWIEGIGSNLERLIDAWDDAAMDSLMLVALRRNQHRLRGSGDFHMDATGRLTRQSGGTRRAVRLRRRFDRASALVRRRAAGPFSLNQLWDRAIEKGRLYGMRLEGIWMHVGTPEAPSAEAEAAISKSSNAGLGSVGIGLMAVNIFTVPLGVPFLEALARAILHGDLPAQGGKPPDVLSLPNISLLLPTRRAARAAREAFLAVSGARAIVMPRIRPISEGEDDLSLLASLAETSLTGIAALEAPPAISALDRTLMLMQLVARWRRTMAEVRLRHRNRPRVRPRRRRRSLPPSLRS